MSRVFLTSTPVRKDSQTSKRDLSSPFSPEEHLTKKNKPEMDESMNMLTMASLPPPDPEILKTVSIVKLYLKDEIASVVKTAVAEAVDTQLKQVKEDNKRLLDENESLKVRVSELESIAEQSEQYSRRNSLRISNIPEGEEEETDAIVLEIADALNVDIRGYDIDRSHRVGKPDTNKKRDILVKFATYRARQRIYGARANLKKTTYNGVYVNEDLTKSRSKLLWEARQKVKGDFLWGAWSADGRLFLKDVKDKVHKLTCSGDIVKHASSVPVKKPEKPKPGDASDMDA